MKKLLVLCGVLTFAAFILGLGTNAVNAVSTPPAGSVLSIQVDGSPLPPPIPPLEVPESSCLRADGSPLPPPIPPLSPDGFSVVLADGSPLPPPIPPALEADRG